MNLRSIRHGCHEELRANSSRAEPRMLWGRDRPRGSRGLAHELCLLYGKNKRRIKPDTVADNLVLLTMFPGSFRNSYRTVSKTAFPDLRRRGVLISRKFSFYRWKIHPRLNQAASVTRRWNFNLNFRKFFGSVQCNATFVVIVSFCSKNVK